MKQILIPILLFAVFIGTGCNDDDPVGASKVKATTFENLVFDSKISYFSTDGSMTQPVDSNEAKKVSSTIDISYIYNSDYSRAGLLDPYTRSQTWYWDRFENKWLLNAVKTKLYSTKLNESDFHAAKSDQSLISSYFSDTSSVKLAPHAIFPLGTSLGGRSTSDPSSVSFYAGGVYGFQNMTTGERGLILVISTPDILDDESVISILKEI